MYGSPAGPAALCTGCDTCWKATTQQHHCHLPAAATRKHWVGPGAQADTSGPSLHMCHCGTLTTQALRPQTPYPDGQNVRPGSGTSTQRGAGSVALSQSPGWRPPLPLLLMSCARRGHSWRPNKTLPCKHAHHTLGGSCCVPWGPGPEEGTLSSKFCLWGRKGPMGPRSTSSTGHRHPAPQLTVPF